MVLVQSPYFWCPDQRHPYRLGVLVEGLHFMHSHVKCSLSLLSSPTFRRITIYGCDVAVFQTFLKYLYSGDLETESMSLDDVIEVLAVADQYETTSLRSLCEGVLVSRVEDSNVFFLLQVADRFSARKLRVSSTYSNTIYMQLAW